jgi:hypothetical protein
MNAHGRPLTGFEERLLKELRIVVTVEGHGSSPEPAALRRFGWKPRLAAVAVVAAALAIGLAVALPTSGSAAYAVTKNANGTVTVEINAFRDAEGLQRKLRENGIPAVVQYIPPGKTCKDGSLGAAPEGSDGGQGLSTVDMRNDGTVRFTIDTGTIRSDQTLVIRMQELAAGQQLPAPPAGATTQKSGAPGSGAPAGTPSEQGATAMSVGFYDGQVGPCELVDA